jgi:predicted RNase H-like HicB family nuclease
VRRYTVVLEFDPETGSYGVTVPVLPGCTSMGRTVEEALVNAKEAITGHIATLEDIGETVPEEPEGAVIIVASVAA